MADDLTLRAADLRRRPSAVRAWLRRHPEVGDTVVVLLACGPHLAALLLRAYDFGWWAVPLLAVTAAALFLRRRYPFPVLVIVALACAFSPLARPGAAFPMLPFAFALYTVAATQPLARAIAGYGVGIAASVLATIPFSLAGVTPPRVTLEPFVLIAFTAGVIVQSRRERTARVVDLVNERIERAALTERTRIAAEMHDVVAHALTVIVSLANGAVSARERQPARADAAVERIATVGRDALGDMHRTLSMLRRTDATLDAELMHSGDNLPSLDELIAGFRAAGLPVELTLAGEPIPDDLALRQALYRIVQESLTNTLRHATEPTRVEVTILHERGRVSIRIEDDGAPHAAVVLPGHGLVGIQERARALGGSAESGPLPGRGWRTSAQLPTETTEIHHD
ncbi:sensor histidine kinase [Leucobacter chromiireducens]|uniref:sensor histidine kinase n=1 Tax=Leucobacter chromiireducens TaxID=283877 RepID=UPI000F63D111|nr:histidine kinase [Leucobacter chromiireducens]